MRNPAGGGRSPSRPGLIRSIAHRLAGERLRPAGRGPPGLVRRRDRLAQLRAADAGGTARTGRPRRLLDLHLRQLAADAAVCPRLGRQVPRRRADGHRRPHARVRVRARRRQHRSRSRATSASSTRSRSTATTASGAPSPTTSGRRSTSPTREGRIRYHHFGEGEYADDRDGHPAAAASTPARDDVDQELVMVDPAGWRWPPTGGRCSRPRRTSATARPPASPQEDVARFDEPHVYAAPARLPLNAWGLSGTWTVARHAAVLERAGRPDRVPVPRARRQPRHGPGAEGRPIPFRVFLDGAARGRRARHRRGRRRQRALDEQRTYQLIRQTGPIAERRFEIEFLDGGSRGVLLHVRLRRVATAGRSPERAV